MLKWVVHAALRESPYIVTGCLTTSNFLFFRSLVYHGVDIKIKLGGI